MTLFSFKADNSFKIPYPKSFLFGCFKKSVSLSSCLFFTFFQRYPSLIVQDDMKNWTHVNLNTSLSFGSMRETIAMIEDIQMELEKMATIGKI